ncbi:MAG: RHS repeat-associated core domain-containing protein, partial [Acidobacteria bacterium]|nr:RHS repeat-associated core domain-containing protein [Acidobacteriota bacterium]
SAGYAYDSNGNMTQMPKGSGSMTLDYDLSNRVSGVSHPDGAEQYRYAPDNRRVWRSAGRSACYASRDNDGMGYWVGYGEGVEEQVIFYSPGGQKMGSYCLRFSQNLQYFAVSASEENVYYGGRLVGKRLLSVTNSNNGLVSDFTADRLQSKGNGSNYYPYGESKPSTAGDDREGFATYTRDEKSGLDYADQRWYASGVGRFTSVDLAQIKVLKAGGLLNGYAYVDSDPINRLDPRGLYYCVPEYHPNGDEQCFTTEPDLTDGSPPPLPPAPAPTKKGLYGDCNPGDSKSETDNLSFLVANYEAAEKVAEIVSQLFNTSMSAGTVLSWAISESGWGTSPKIGSNGTYLNARTGGNWIEQSTCKAGSDARWACFASFEQSLTSGFFSPMFMTGYVDRNGISTDRPSAGYIYADQIARGSSIAITFQQIAGGGSGGGWDRGNSKYGTNVQDVLRGVNIRLDCLKLNNYIK